jgi:hypothetical protein
MQKEIKESVYPGNFTAQRYYNLELEHLIKD